MFGLDDALPRYNISLGNDIFVDYKPHASVLPIFKIHDVWCQHCVNACVCSEMHMCTSCVECSKKIMSLDFDFLLGKISRG